MFGDSTSSFGIVNRLGSGKVKHIGVKQLWLQQVIREQSISLHHAPTMQNWADMLTKNLQPRLLQQHCDAIGLQEMQMDSDQIQLLEEPESEESLLTTYVFWYLVVVGLLWNVILMKDFVGRIFGGGNRGRVNVAVQTAQTGDNAATVQTETYGTMQRLSRREQMRRRAAVVLEDRGGH